MIETIYNLFAYVNGGSLTRVGIVAYEVEGSDSAKLSHLQERARLDHADVFGATLVEPLAQADYQAMQRLGRGIDVFAALLDHVGAPAEIVSCVTVIVDGVPVIDVSLPHGVVDASKLPERLVGPGSMDDYLMKYLVDGTFDMPQLINDDYYLAIKLLFNNRHYISCLKLLVSFLDTVAFIEAGKGNFVPWLVTYADLTPVGITGEELWELRNGLLHMTNLDSRKVLSGDHARLIPYVGQRDLPPSSDPTTKHFNVSALLAAIAVALGKWFATYRETPDKMVSFIQRYDRVVSDSRLALVRVDP